MKNSDVPEMPLCTNILRLQSYLLSPDEAILFDWFIVKQIAFHYKDFHYSQARIEKETRIKRSRQEAIICKFTEWGFLKTEVKFNTATQGRVRYFSIDFSVLTKNGILSQIINPEGDLFKAFMRYMKFHKDQQKNLTKPTFGEKFDYMRARYIYELLNETYNNRLELYNSGGLTSTKPKRAKSQTQLEINKSIERKLCKLFDTYNADAIKNAFTCYTDYVLKGITEPRNFMHFFLYYNKEMESFDVFEEHLGRYNMYYSYDNI